MDTISLADAETQLGALIDRVAIGDSVAITRDGRPVALLTRTDIPLQPISLDVLRAVTVAMPEQGESAGSFIRTMRDEDRY
ncbi:type II toxin-antitoxin system prevent-host-death family antitoxin [Methylobacterium sp. E-065]|uniref:type II toxin-antitoxin system Phd/YefM family antitoxin n=1 Tax=Methylobacterium sp. E-065 TaxID=2836583 RepID=UPI001FBB21FA|nr:type II toxin-antitoxin system prevent-host-death family antitoxin [Methylobacterium sp. E-065]MCJ2017705.1 type II toxin-antitoxin system prevent-host-death family antitoxin [Methylobacterium sp. E-065]